MNIIEKSLFFDIFGTGSLEGEHSNIFTGNDIEPLIAFSRTFKPETVVEIGIHRGDTAKVILSEGTWIKKYIGIDVPPEHKTSLSVQQCEVPKKAGESVRDDDRVEIIVRPNGSHDLKPGQLPKADLIFIDGDHSYEGILSDTHLARKILRNGGAIFWHDYGNSLVPDVKKAIDDINRKEGNHICSVQNTSICFQFYSQEWD